MNIRPNSDSFNVAAAEQDKLLIANGYRPIPVIGKAPAAEGWRDGAVTSERLAAERAEHPDAVSTGLRTDTIAGIDLDIIDADHLQRFVDLAYAELGETTLIRRGAKGWLMVYRRDEPLRKITAAPADKAQAKRAKVEILGAGQQFVAFGIHPDTGRPYEWLHPDPDGLGVLSPLDVPLHLVPAVTSHQLRSFAGKAAALLTELGYGAARVTGDTGKQRPEPLHAGLPVAATVLRDALSHLDPFGGRDEWRNVIAAIRAADIGNDDEARQIAVEWSRGELGSFTDTTPPHYTGDDDVVKAFDTLPPKAGGIAVGTLFDMAHAAGWTGSPFNDGVSMQEKFGDAAAKLATKEAPSLAPDADGARHFSGLTYYVATDIKPEEIEWIWPKRFAAGMIGMIAGFPDQGKSLIATAIAATVSTGGQWPFGEGTAKQGAVIILSAEDHKAQVIKPRLTAAGADTDQCLIVEASVTDQDGQHTLNLADDLDRIGAMIDLERDRGRDVKLIIIDPISAYVGGKSKGDSFKNSEMRALLTPLAGFAEKRKVAVICISHFNKGGNSHALYRVTDSLAFTAACRTTWLTADEQNEGEATGRKLFLKGKNNIAPDPGGLAYKFDTVAVEVGPKGFISAPRIVWDGCVAVTAEEALAEQSGKRKGSAVADAVEWLQGVLGNGPVQVVNIHEQAEGKHSWRTVIRAKAQLGITSQRLGGVGEEGKWHWVMPEVEPATE